MPLGLGLGRRAAALSLVVSFCNLLNKPHNQPNQPKQLETTFQQTMDSLDLVVAPGATTITVCARVCEVAYDSLTALIELLFGLVAQDNQAQTQHAPPQQTTAPSPYTVSADMLADVGSECAALAGVGYDALCLAGTAICPTANLVVNCVALGADHYRGRLSATGILAYAWNGICECAKLVRVGASAGYLSFEAYDPATNAFRGITAFKAHLNGSPLLLAGILALLALRTAQAACMWLYTTITN